MSEPYFPEKYRPQVEALQTFIAEVLDVKEPYSVTVCAFECEEAGGFRIAEISIACESSGSSYMRCDAVASTLATILAAEDFVRMFNVKPYRPEGWQSDIDDFDDAKFKLRAMLKPEPKSKRKFFKTVIQVEVLSEDKPIETEDLNEINDIITTGDCSGVVSITEATEIDGPTTANLLHEQGSEPGFFQLDDKGNDLEDE